LKAVLVTAFSCSQLFKRFTISFIHSIATSLFLLQYVNMKKIILPAFILLALASCHNDNKPEEETRPETTNLPKALTYNITNVYPHNTSSFTEGLEWRDSSLYESTGNYGQSKLLRTELKDGKVLKSMDVAKEFFGEGMTVLNGKIYQLTYKEQKCFVYNAKTFAKIGEFAYEGEGWGMTNDGKQIIMGNGSSNLYFRDPNTFKVTNIVGVTNNYGPVGNINELEYVDGFVYANVWMTFKILKIDPSSGHVVGEADFSGIKQKYFPELPEDATDVFNGIAYDSVGKRFFITGKLWPKIFEVKFN